MIKPNAYNNIGKIIHIIEKSNLQINKMRMTKFSVKDAEEFYAEHKGKPFFQELVSFITSDVVVGFELIGEKAIEIWRNLIGPTNTAKAKIESPNSIRALFGEDNTKNAVHGSDSPVSAQRELQFFFENENRFSRCAVLTNCACMIIKPHILQSQIVGKIIDRVLEEGFEISAMEMFYLNKPTVEEFFEVYRGVLPEFVPMVEHMTTGPAIVMEIRQENAVKSLRDLIGPHDPEVSKHLRPKTIRAIYGIDRVKNAAHCTDLDEDGILEVI